MRQHGDPNRNYAKEWREWRIAKGWTQRELAATLCLSLRTILHVEHGTHPPSLSSRDKMNQLQKRHREANQ